MLNDALAGTIAFKHDSKFLGCSVSSGDTTLGSVALVCGIGLYRSLEVVSTSGCWYLWNVSGSCPLARLLTGGFRLLLLFAALYCPWLWSTRSLLCSLVALCFLCCLLAVSFLLALAPSLCSTSFSLSPSLAVALLLISGFSSQSFLVYLSLVSLLVYLVWPSFTLGGPGLSRRRSRSVMFISFLLIVLFWCISPTFSPHPWSRISCQCKYT